jgi:dTDP-4-dehydrorhamnose reductase
MDVLVVGGSGMLGHKVLQHLLDSGANVGCTLQGGKHESAVNRELFSRASTVLDSWDALETDVALERIAAHAPRVVVNCLGIIKQREAAKQPIPSIMINALWPHRLTEASALWGGRVIHFSTDCVFSGQRGGYCESDAADAQDLYGRTKYLGEVTGSNALTLRTSIIGRELNHYSSLLEWFLSQQGKSVKGFTQAWFSGVTTNHLAVLVRRLMIEYPDLTGLYHVAGPKIAKYDLLCGIRDSHDLNIEIIPDDSFFCDRSLNSDQFLTSTGLTTPSWRDMLAELAADPTPYAKWQAQKN